MQQVNDATAARHGSARPLRVLTVTHLWPTASDPSYGAPIRAQMEGLRAAGVEYDPLFINGRESKWNYLKSIFEVRRRVPEKKYDVVYAHFVYAGWVARFQWRAPVVVKFLGDDVLGQFNRRGRKTFKGRVLQILSFALVRVIQGSIVLSEEMRRKLGRKEAVVISPGVDLKLFCPMDQEECRRELALDLKKKYVLFPYDPSRALKRFDLIEEAVRLARGEQLDVEILLVRGEAQARLPIYYNAADMLVVASEVEGGPNTVKEAMAVNLPVISVDVGYAREVIGSTDGCYIVSRDAREIAAKIVEVCRRGARTNGRERVARWSVESASLKTIELFDRAVRKWNGAVAEDRKTARTV